MPAYVIADVDVTDPDLFAKYRALVPATLEKYGGRFLVRGGESRRLEGDWAPHRLVVLQFASMADAQRWYESSEYREALALRTRSARTDAVLVEGV